MNKEFFRKNKKILLISGAIVVVGALFFLKTSNVFQSNNLQNEGLIYAGETVGDLVNQDTGNDGIPDWEKILWGLNPKDPNDNADGLSDAAEIAKMKQAAGITGEDTTGDSEQLTQTAQFSRQLFATVASLTETGGMDQNTVNQLSDTVAQQIVSQPTQKVYTAADVKTTNDESVQAYQKYSDALGAIFKKSPVLFAKGYSGVVYEIGSAFLNVMQDFQTDDGADVSVVSQLSPVTQQVQTLETGMVNMTTPVPASIATLHTNVINGLEKVLENLQGIQEVETDPIVAAGATAQFSDNMDALQTAIGNLSSAMNQKLSN